MSMDTKAYELIGELRGLINGLDERLKAVEARLEKIHHGGMLTTHMKMVGDYPPEPVLPVKRDGDNSLIINVDATNSQFWTSRQIEEWRRRRGI